MCAVPSKARPVLLGCAEFVRGAVEVVWRPRQQGSRQPRSGARARATHSRDERHDVKRRSRMGAAPVQKMAGDCADPSRVMGIASCMARPRKYHVQKASATDARS
eukprot:scaffold3819_cov107-Isochrysis_galbana.AAC.2